MDGAEPDRERLTPRSLRRGVAALRARDARLAGIVDRIGVPPLWARRPGFATLIGILLGQQVSLASARAAYDRLQGAVGRVVPSRIAAVSEARLRRAGLTRQKASYCRQLAHRARDGCLDLQRLERQDDDTVRATLVSLPGIGPWTADIYLLMALLRPDVWPEGDLALVSTVQEVEGLRRRPDGAELRRIAAKWRPWRAVAARILWHWYLNGR